MIEKRERRQEREREREVKKEKGKRKQKERKENTKHINSLQPECELALLQRNTSGLLRDKQANKLNVIV